MSSSNAMTSTAIRRPYARPTVVKGPLLSAVTATKSSVI